MAEFKQDFLRPLDPNTSFIDPANAAPAHLEPTSLFSGVTNTYSSVVAAGADFYRSRMEEEYGKLQDKLGAAGLAPHRLFMMNEDFVTFPEFQALMNERSPFPGIDERYQDSTDRQAAVRKWVDDTNSLVLKGKTQRPDLSFETLGEIHNRIMGEIKQDRQAGDSVSGWRGHLGAFMGGLAGTGVLAAKGDPAAMAQVGSMAFGGIGPNVLTRLATLGATNAGLNVLSEASSMDTLKQAGVPVSAEDLAWTAAFGFAGGVVFGGVGELFSGASGRAAMNDRYAWMTLSKREGKLNAINPGSGYSPAFWENKTQEAPTPILVPEPRAVIPSGVPGAIDRLRLQAPGDVLAGMDTSPIGFVPRAQRGPLLVLNRVSTKAQKVRWAEDLDHIARQYLADMSVAPQDLIPPSRPMSPTATMFPEVRSWVGPGIADVPELPSAWQRAAKGKTLRTEDTARQVDSEAWKKGDALGARLRAAKAELGRVIGFIEDARAGKAITFDKHVGDLHEQFLRARTDASRQAILKEIDDVTAFNEQLKQTRRGGETPTAPKSFDVATYAKRVADLQAKWDAMVPDLERSTARAQKLWGLQMADAKAFDEAMRPGASDWVHSPWRWPVGFKRAKDAPKNPYEVKLLKGSSQKELFAKYETEFDQMKSYLASEVTAPGDTPIKVATKVNDKHYEDVAKVDAEAFYKTTRDFMKALDEGVDAGPSQRLPKTGQRESIKSKPLPKQGVDIAPHIAPERAGMVDNNTVIGLASESRVKLLDNTEQEVTMKGGKIYGKDNLPIAPANVLQFKNKFTGAGWVTVQQPLASMPAGMTIRDLWDKGSFEFEPGKPLTMKEALNEIATDEEAFTRFGQCVARP